MKCYGFLLAAGLLLCGHYSVKAQAGDVNVPKQLQALRNENTGFSRSFEEVLKKMDDVLWYDKVGDVAFVDKVFLCGPPKANPSNPTAMGVNNPLKFWAYVFVPKSVNPDKKYPLIVFAHSGVHADFSTYYAHIIRELMAQEYIVVAAEYRGSTGYGAETFNNIDYGGLENQDVYESGKYMVENYSFVDKDRIGVMGWSHGGMITLMNLMTYPGVYKCGFAGVPVCDVIARMGYSEDSYREMFKEDIGKSARDNIAEYKRRSPVWHAEKLQDPVLIHTNTNDDDVNVIEVEHMIRALKAEGKQFDYKIFRDMPGGHSFDRIDIKEATDIRYDIYKYLEKYLKPSKPFKSAKDLRVAAYRFN